MDISAARAAARDLFLAGVKAADPYTAVKDALREAPVEGHGPVHLIAVGKAAGAMMRGALESIPASRLAGEGLVVTNYENAGEIPGCRVFAAGHPLPDDNGHAAAQAVAERAAAAGEGEELLVLVSGGASALLPLPTDGISLEEKITTTNLLLGCGADIVAVNTVRKHLSNLKGGGLARLAVPARLRSLILSDVIGDDLSSIASGPTVPDPTTFKDAVNILETAGVWQRLPESVRRHLDEGRQGEIADTPKPGDPVFDNCQTRLVGGNGISVAAMADQASSMELTTEIYSNALCGEARDEAARFVEFARRFRLQKNPNAPVAFLAGGETTVTLTGKGRGGRNQEIALAVAVAAEAQGMTGDWVFLSGGTDGRDGPTDAAGGMVDPGTLTRMRAAGCDPMAHLADNDAYHALQASDDLLMTGGTGTNVADLQVFVLL